MATRYEIRLAGTGGQGVILAGILLAEAAVHDGLNVVQTQSYGPEARGGASRAEVIISDEEAIHYPKVIEADVMLCMSQEACDRYSGRLRKDGLLILDADHVTRAPTTRAVRVPLTTLARELTGDKLAANVVGLGVLAGLTGMVTRASMEHAVCARTPSGTQEANLQALAAGYEAAEQEKEDCQDI